MRAELPEGLKHLAMSATFRRGPVPSPSLHRASTSRSRRLFATFVYMIYTQNPHFHFCEAGTTDLFKPKDFPNLGPYPDAGYVMKNFTAAPKFFGYKNSFLYDTSFGPPCRTSMPQVKLSCIQLITNLIFFRFSFLVGNLAFQDLGSEIQSRSRSVFTTNREPIVLL